MVEDAVGMGAEAQHGDGVARHVSSMAHGATAYFVSLTVVGVARARYRRTRVSR
jgi:hypothetical protein